MDCFAAGAGGGAANTNFQSANAAIITTTAITPMNAAGGISPLTLFSAFANQISLLRELAVSAWVAKVVRVHANAFKGCIDGA